MPHAFDTATHVEPTADGGWTTTIDARWNAPTGPNGGYLAAIVLRAIGLAVGDPARLPRTMTLHYLRGPKAGPAVVHVDVVRTGRAVATATARLEQDGRPCIVAVAALIAPQPERVGYLGLAAPDATPWPEAKVVVPREPVPDLFSQLEIRPLFGPRPFSGGEERRTGGWLRFAAPRPVDAPALAMWADAWWPVVFGVLDRPMMAPTIELTIHFPRTLPAGEDPEAPVLGVFTTASAGEGLMQEDAALYSPGGVLLAHARQLALMRELPA